MGKIAKIKVLFLFVHLHKGGMQRAVSNISQALPLEFDQYVGYFGTENPGYFYNAKMHDFCLPGISKTSLLQRILTALIRIKKLNVFLKENKIDVVVSFGKISNFYNLLSSSNSAKIITSRVAEEKNHSKFLAFFNNYLLRYIYNRCDAAVGVSKKLAKDLENYVLHHKVVHIPNLYNIDHIINESIMPIPDEYKWLLNKRYIINVGSLCYQKGQDLLIEIFHRLTRDFPDLYLVLLGRGELKSDLQAYAAQLSILNRLVFIDFDVNPYRYMHNAEAFVLTSRYEGFPNVLLEAMICSLPVVAFDCETGPAEILSNGEFGYLIRNKDSYLFTDCLQKILRNSAHRDNLAIKSQVRSQDYASHRIIKLWTSLFKDALIRKSAST